MITYAALACYLFPEKKLVDMDTENKITRKHMKRLRKQLSGEKGGNEARNLILGASEEMF